MRDFPMEFELKPEHVRLLRRAYVGWQDCETGAPEIDPKRPYGNSYVVGDVAEILEEKIPDEDQDGGRAYELWENTRGEELMSLHYETATALQIVLVTGSFEPGRYRRRERYDTTAWERIEPVPTP